MQGIYNNKILCKLLDLTGLVERCFVRKKGLIILMYHSIYSEDQTSEYMYGVSSKNFKRHMTFLKGHANFIDPMDIMGVEDFTIEKDLNILLTFDDGFMNNYSEAFPVMKELGIPGLIFLTTSDIADKEKRYLNWDQIKEMDESGSVVFGSHCAKHLNLKTLDNDNIIEELTSSKSILEDRLNKEVLFFSYPGGGYNRKIMGLVKKCGYKAAFKDRLNLGEANNEDFSIGRIGILKRDESISAFRSKICLAKTIKHINIGI